MGARDDNMKPIMLYLYDYEMPPWKMRAPHSMPFLLEKALKEFFEIKHEGEITAEEADIVFNTLPLWLQGGAGNCVFRQGKITFLWNQTPLEGLLENFLPQVDVLFCGTPKFVNKEKGELLLPALDPSYREYPEEKIYDIGFLGSEMEAYRINFLNLLDKKFKLLRRNGLNLGEESAKELSKCKLVLSIEDWHAHQASIEFRLWTFGHVRPILMHYNPDLEVIGKPDEMYISYHNPDSAVEKIEYYLAHMDDAEKIGNNLKKNLEENHTYRHRAKQVFETYQRLKK